MRSSLSAICGALALFFLPALDISAKEPESGPGPRKTVLLLGDSLGAGYGVSPNKAFAALLQEKISAAHLPFILSNASISGDTTSGGRRRLSRLLQKPVDVLLLELGGNDGLRGIPVEVTRENLQSMIDMARQANAAVRIILAGMRMPPNLGPEYTTKFAGIYEELARQNHIALIPFLLEGVGGNADLNLPDQIHPTEAGHVIIAANIWKILEPVLQEKSRRPSKETGPPAG